MTVDASLQIRKLPPSHVSQLSLILEFSEQWKKLMAVIPNKLEKGTFECCISAGNPAKYNIDHIRIIEAASQKYKKSGTEILLDEWGCSERVLPTVGHLLHLLLKAELFRAADYVSEKILGRTSMKRPSLGPAANVPVSINGNIEENLDNMNYSSSLIEKLNFSSFNNNLNHETSCIPQIVVTPDADESAQNPTFLDEMSNTNNVAVSLPNLIMFSEEMTESDRSNGDEASSQIESGTKEFRPDEPCIPVISMLLEENSGSQQSSTMNASGTEESISEDTIPDLTQLNQSSENCVDSSKSIVQPGNVIDLDENRDCEIPNLSVLNVESKVGNDDLIPNLSGLNQSDSSVNDDDQNSSTNTLSFEGSNRCISNIKNEERMTETSKSIKGNENTDNLPDISGLIQSSYEQSSSDLESAEIASINSPYQSRNEQSSDTMNYEDDSSMPNLNVLIPESSRLTVSTFDSSKSRKCNSPLPNLTLTTHLPHYTYEKLKASTNGFNEGVFEGFNKEGRLLGAGAFGKVFLATGISQEPVAVKKIILGNVEVVDVDDRITKHFINEVEVLSKFKHKNLVSLLGFSCDGCTYCLLYEYIPGGTLKDRLQSSDAKLTWQERLSIGLGTSNAITYLHTAFSSPLIHRDVKTANILLDNSNKPKLGDFGITTLLDKQNTNTCTVIGTSAYMAPEAMRGDISEKCDTFSFGVVLLELLTSLPPFDESRDGHDLITHVEEKCEDSIGPLLDKTVGSWRMNDVNFGDEIYSVAVQCLEEKKKRPLMVDVTEMLMIIVSKL